MSLPILQYFGAGLQGCQTPVDKPIVLEPWEADYNVWRNAMPLVVASEIQTYQNEFNRFSPVMGPAETRDIAPPGSGTIQFDRYTFNLITAANEPVYALATSYMYWLHDGKPYPDHLGGAVVQPNESILILKPVPLDTGPWLPAKIPVLTECAYLNVDMDENLIKDQIRKYITEKYHKQLYKQIIGTDWPADKDWVDAYFELFRDYPQVSVIVRGSEMLGTIPGTDLSVYFKIGDKWTEHGIDVVNFFHYNQRYYYLIGHPLIALLDGFSSVSPETVDVLAHTNLQGFWMREKKSLVDDFDFLVTNNTPEYHPVALGLEEHPMRLAVPRFSGEITLPVQHLILREDHFFTRLKVHNPLGLQIKCEFNADYLDVLPAEFSGVGQIVEIKAKDSLPATVSQTSLIFSVNEEVVLDLKATFFDLRTISIKFHKLIDKDDSGNSIYNTIMDVPTLRQVIDYANEMLGRQTNTYIVPVPDENGVILHDLDYTGEFLGEIIEEPEARILGKYIYNNISDHNDKKINVVFVWKFDVPDANPLGVTVPNKYHVVPDDPQSVLITHASILVNTKDPNDPFQLAKALIHEIGHFLSFIFSYFPDLANNRPVCDGPYKHFKHPPAECAGGDWTFNNNFMGKSGAIFISHDQAIFFNNNAHLIEP